MEQIAIAIVVALSVVLLISNTFASFIAVLIINPRQAFAQLHYFYRGSYERKCIRCGSVQHAYILNLPDAPQNKLYAVGWWGYRVDNSTQRRKKQCSCAKHVRRAQSVHIERGAQL